jgi:hypothetical protein
MIEAHIETRRRHHDRGAAGDPEDATQMGIFRFGTTARSPAFEEKPNATAARGDRQRACPPARPPAASRPRQAVRRLDGHLRLLARGAARHPREQPGIDFGKEIIPKALGTHRVHPYIFRGYWADVGTIARSTTPTSSSRSGRAVQLLPSPFPDLHAPALSCPAHARATTAVSTPRSSPKAATSIVRDRRLGRRDPDARQRGARSPGRCCSAPTSTRRSARPTHPDGSASAATSCSTA